MTTGLERVSSKLERLQAWAKECGFVGEVFRGRGAYWIHLDGEKEPEFLAESYADSVNRLRMMARLREEAYYVNIGHERYDQTHPYDEQEAEWLRWWEGSC